MGIGEKGLIFEPFQSRIYTHAKLFSHIIGQVDYDNYGISGLEKNFDKELKRRIVSSAASINFDINIQYLVNKELEKALEIFEAPGGGSLLMDVETGEILSLVSLPNFDINQRADLKDKRFINKITKGVYELGSIHKTFTVALALDNNLVNPKTIIKNIPNSIKCSNHQISDVKNFTRTFCGRYFNKVIKRWNLINC